MLLNSPRRPGFVPSPSLRVLLSASILMACGLYLLGQTSAVGQLPAASSPAARSADAESEAGARSFMPTVETGVNRMWQKFPEHDGRGVVVAVLDSGVDPGAAGLLKTSEGKPKVIDIIDATGSGDVDMSTIIKPANGTLVGLTGRTLKLPVELAQGASEIRIGMKAAWKLFPGGNDGGELVRRLQAARRRTWDEQNDALIIRLRKELDAFNRNPPAGPESGRQREELEARIEQARELAQTYSDPGPVFDCVMFRMPDHWLVGIDTDEDGDLTDEKLLREYHIAQEFGTFGPPALLNYGVHVYDGGNVLSIVVDSSSHGTHVAGIIGGYFPESPELNGMAPGVQIVSVKIGDSRLGSMETGQSLTRAIAAVRKHNCDLINMSYGEPTTRTNAGRFMELANELVNKHGVIYLCSAGNEGPALSTPGAPGSTTDAVIGVGAYFSPAMQVDQYAARKAGAALPYSFSSRGPAHDGSLGIDLFAPGGAISAYPTWTLQNKNQANGTSMASPNACGGVALILSGLKAAGVKYTSASIERALQTTSKKLADHAAVDSGRPLGEGPGVMQVDAAFEHLVKHAAAKAEPWRFPASIPMRGSARGILLREPHEVFQPYVGTVFVNPQPPDESDVVSKQTFEMPLKLKSTQKWVSVGTDLFLVHNGRGFEVRVDPRDLKPGVHYAEVHALDASAVDRGPLFRVPVTVIVPEFVDHGQTGIKGAAEGLEPGSIHRRFVVAPEGATWAEVIVTSSKAPEQRGLEVHAVQVRKGRSHRDDGTKSRLQLQPGVPAAASFAVQPGLTLEICLSSSWANAGPATYDYQVKFHGAIPSDGTVTLSGDGLPTRVDVSALLEPTPLSPTAELNVHRRLVSPSSSSITLSSDERDAFPEGRIQSKLLLTYEFELADSGRVLLGFPQIDGLLYEAELDGQLWMLYDSNKSLVAVDDMRPETQYDLRAGKYTLRLQLAHSDPKALEAYRSLPLAVDRFIPPINVRISGSRLGTSDGGNVNRTLRAGERTGLYLAAPTSLPGGVVEGDTLLGTVQYERVAGTLGAGPNAGRRPVPFSLRYTVPGRGPTSRPDRDSSGKADSVEAAIRAAKVRYIESLNFEKKRDEFNTLYEELLKENPDDLKPRVLKLHRLDVPDLQDDRLPEIVAMADEIISRIDTARLAAYFGQRHAKDANPDMQFQRETLIDALYRKGRALGYMDLPEVVARHPAPDPARLAADFDANFAEFEKWTDPAERPHVLLLIRKERRGNRPAVALRWVHKHLPAAVGEFWFHKKREELCERLGWTHQVELERRRQLIQFPKTFEPF